MGRDPNPRLVQVLYIGRSDSAYNKLWEQLQREGINVAFAATQKAGLEQATELQPQVAIINANGASFSAERLCRYLSRRVPNTRRLVILDRAQDEVPCEQALVRPFTVRKLRDTLFTLLEETAPHILRTGALQLDLIAKTVMGPLGEHHLTPKQCSLLAIFMRHPNHVISRKDLMDLIWDTEYLGDTRTLDVHIRWLREKIEPDPKRPVLLVTRRGIGYLLAVSEPIPNGHVPAFEIGVMEAD